MKNNPGIVLGLIPARGESKGVKDKNIRPILGRPVISYAIECGLSCPSIDHLVVSTDSEKIAGIAKEHRAEVPFMRPRELARNESPMMPVLEHALKACESFYNAYIECIVLLDATSPMTTTDDIEKSVALFKSGDYDAVISAVPARRNPYFNMVVMENGYARLAMEPRKPVTRRQDCPPVYDLNNSIWIFSRKAILEDRDRIPKKSAIYIMDEGSSVDVDSETDLKILEVLMREKNV